MLLSTLTRSASPSFHFGLQVTADHFGTLHQHGVEDSGDSEADEPGIPNSALLRELDASRLLRTVGASCLLRSRAPQG